MKIGDEVITMSAAGRFKIVAIEGDTLRITNAAGHQKLVHVANVRKVPPSPGADPNS
ncbi:MAG TPA: hypothetical protein VEB21_18755 [Terriglobales bacterium]|nr:hypothetical protein [Terriglobales bacterium]